MKSMDHFLTQQKQIIILGLTENMLDCLIAPLTG